MDFYYKKRRWKILLLFGAILIGLASFFYTSWLVKKMALEERKNVELWANATKQLAVFNTEENTTLNPESNTNKYAGLLLDILGNNTTIPIIIVGKDGGIINDKNINYNNDRKEQVLKRELHKMKNENDPIKIVVFEDEIQYLYYRDSYILRNLKFFPLVQLSVVFLFIIVSYFAFSSSRKAEQNQVWVGMSRETAHQLGTPISSLMAWVELLKMKDVDPKLVAEFEKDTQRLGKIAERFSKIGSSPELFPTDLGEMIESTASYLRNRISDRIQILVNGKEEKCWVALNAPLFSWVIENLCKNAVDAIESDGTIIISIYKKAKQVFVDVSDTGKGISKSQFKTIFEPGFTTKKRGWGLGLSLAKRIVENYHQGKIFIKHSELGKGTTFRIILKCQEA